MLGGIVRRVVLVIGLFSLIIGGVFAQTTTVYNNFGPEHDGWDYNYQTGWTVAGVDVEQQFGVEQAMEFESTADGVVTDIWVGFFYVPMSSMADTVTIRLVANLFGLPPDTTDILEEWLLTDFDSWNQWDPPIHLEGNGTTMLENGASYWLWALAEETTWTGWCMNINPTLTCQHTLRREGENWLSISYETASAFRVDVSDTSVDEEIRIVQGYNLLTAYPNPFNPSTNLSYTLDSPSLVNLTVYDALGREVAVLINGFQSAGTHVNALHGSNLAGGVYFAVLRAGQQTFSQRIVLVK